MKKIIKPYLKKVKAVIHVSLNNRCKKLDKIKSLCKMNNVFLIE